MSDEFVSDNAVAKSGTDPATRPESYQMNAAHAPNGLLNVY
jgi:hypothetical protein